MFYRSRKKNLFFVITLIVIMILSGYTVGRFVGKNNIKDNAGNLGYRTISAEDSADREVGGRDIPFITITPDTRLIFEKEYLRCGDSRVEERRAEPYEIGLSRQEMTLRFPEWYIKEYSMEKVVLVKEIDDYCSNHFILKERDGRVVVYMPSEYEDEYRSITETGIIIGVLPSDMQEDIHKGLVLDSLEDIETFIENFDS
ncbi:MAG: hypothetical protein GX352_06380 [Clostridiales bacterium]|nr:hypothetical protein [Clostridiales bacterium]